VILLEQAMSTASRVYAFVEQLPIEKFHGIGEVTAAKMHSLGIHTGAI
jgi:nucleotidyltransferase/DNA polymerase involved in DNA repair